MAWYISTYDVMGPIIIFLSVTLYLAYAWNSGDGQTYVGISTVDADSMADRQTPCDAEGQTPFWSGVGRGLFRGVRGGTPPG